MKIGFKPERCVSQADYDRNVEYAHTLGLPFVRMAEVARGPLAVIGGAPSIRSRLSELQAFAGERWIIGSSFRWCLENDVDGVFFCIDPQELVGPLAMGAKRALLASSTHPSVLDQLISDGCEIELFDIGSDAVPTGSTTATAAIYLSLMKGHDKVFFYGCDCNHGQMSHAYGNRDTEYSLVIECGGQEFQTNPHLIMQAEELCAPMSAYPNIYVDRSGGLLAAMLEHGTDWNVLKVSRALNDQLQYEQKK